MGRAGNDREPDTPSLRALAPRSLTEPHPHRLGPDHPSFSQVIAAHAAAIDAGEDTYIDPDSGLVVLTAGFLARRGFCCESGCRHCPYVV